MALENQTDMDFTPQSPLSTAPNGTAPTPCEELASMKIYIRRLQIICNEKERTVSLLSQDKGHDEGCSHVSPKCTPKNTPPPSPTRRNNQQKRKDEDDFEFPPLRKTARKTILQEPEDIGIENQYSLLPNVIIKQVSGQLAPPTANNSEPTASANQRNGSSALPPPLMLRIDDDYRFQVDTIKKIYPHLRLKTTGEYIKLYSNTTEQNRVVRQTLIQLGYRFYVITPKNERPIKIVIKGYPKKSGPRRYKKRSRK
ncbi:hypothetical protein TNCV_1971411 [Trichonephila clavipes]|uniref:Uncharacterized protein n=1 Tax=Trichonephila clavipes TaxID=2585209 RepID=A0A8X7BEM0_TRICX|nr:hypothetical protein TNCV_1971411 [Trichonephila clavipes]